MKIETAIKYLYKQYDSYPDWDMRISFEGYTTVLEIDVPDNVELTWYNNG